MKGVTLPDFVEDRMKVWDELKEKKKANESEKEKKPIKITLPDGSVKEGVSFETSPLDIANGISSGLARAVIVALVNDKEWDLARPLEGDCQLELLKFDNPRAQHVFWHSSAHILGEALEITLKGHLCIGPPLDDGGFYYDMASDKPVSPEDIAAVQKLVSSIVKDNQQFERMELTKQEALQLFKNNKYKEEIITKQIADDEQTTAYRCGPLIDLCRGPHIPTTKRVAAFKVLKSSSAYWRGKAENDALQRVYGISFPDKKQLKQWEEFQAKAAKRDHRVVGKAQSLFFFDPLSPGSAFWLPHGTRIYAKLLEYMRNQYHKRGFTEVITPNIFNFDLWKISGHADKYAENLYTFQTRDDEKFGLKPMNCPGHCLMFRHVGRSYRELPIRFADFGVLHRNELSGALGGLTRVRRFQQDDAHIFCLNDQVEQEIAGAIDFMEEVYNLFQFEFELELSTRPEQFLGEPEVWDQAEDALRNVLNAYTQRSGKSWRLNAGDGAFYGPKIDIHIYDAMRRSHQCATIQLDFQLPIRFNLEYNGEEGTARPVIIHRAIFGSLERFLGILIEQTGGRWPLWISPRQVCVVSVAATYNAYAEKVVQRLSELGYYADASISDKTMNKRVAEASKLQYNYILVVGEKEEETNGVNVRPRPKAGQKFVKQELMSMADFEAKLAKEVGDKVLPPDADWLGEEEEEKKDAGKKADAKSAPATASSSSNDKK
mmetsp:Transcript_18007/g.31514  ORF Transcript_18007/g.31514 Transcript_18007/m.31514 type:complete len:717 (-) Transcript_18007:31-2181(-)